MTDTLSAMALFCEDIREELGGSLSLVGLLPDTINIVPAQRPGAPPPPGQGTGGKPAAPPRPNRMLTRLCILIRINFDPDDEFETLQVRVTMPNGSARVFDEIAPATLEQARAHARESGLAMAAIVSRHVFNNFQAGKPGLLKAEVLCDGKSTLAGALSFCISTGKHEYTISSSLH